MTVTVPANDHGLIRIFSVTPPVSQALLDNEAVAVARALGTDGLNMDFVDVVDTRNLAGLTLLDYLHQGYDIPGDATDDAALREISGPVILVMSRATGGVETTITPATGVRHVTTVGAPARMAVPESPLPSAAAAGTVRPGKAVPTERAMSGRIALIALLVLLAVVALMIWIAA